MEADERPGVMVSFDSVVILTVHLNTASNEMVAIFLSASTQWCTDIENC